MAWDGTGQYVLNPLYTPEVNGNVVDAPRYNGALTDIAAGITACVAKNGENIPTANLPMGGYKHTGAGAATGPGQYVIWDQVVSLGQVAGVLTPNRQAGAYTVLPSDAGKDVVHPSSDTTARTWTLQADSTANWPDGAIITFSNLNGAGAITITSVDTIRLAGTTSTGNRTLAANGVCTAIWRNTESFWHISGTGLT